MSSAIIDTDQTRVGELLAETSTTFTVKQSRIDYMTIRRGYGIIVDLVYAGDDEPDEPVAADVYVVSIDPKSCTFVGGVLCAHVDRNYFVPVENFGDDESDLSAARFFETRTEAEDHAVYIGQRLRQNGIEVA